MDWKQARRLLHLDAPTPNAPRAEVRSVRSSRDGIVRSRGRSVCVASGKGGTGKSVVTASLASCFARTGPTLLVDADLGVGNAHILQDVAPERSFVDLVEGRAHVRDVRASCGPNLDLISAGSGVSRMANLASWEMHLVATALTELEGDYDHLLVDSAAGISPQTVQLAAASDLVLLVTTPDVTALTDAYAFLKVLLARRADARVAFVVNRASGTEEGAAVAERLQGVARKFLGREPRFLGALPDDRAVVRCVNARAPVVEREPESSFARAFGGVFERVRADVATQTPRGLGRSISGGRAAASGM